MKVFQLLALLFVLSSGVAYGGKADVIEVKVKEVADNVYHFEVTVVHTDEGWKHYADRWDVVAPDGTILATRTLHHPHVKEQPFTRSLSGVKIPKTIERVTVRAHDSLHDYGGRTVTVDLP